MNSQLPLLLEVEGLQALIENNQLAAKNVLLVQVTSLEVFEKAHIAHAVHVAPGELMSGIAPAKGTVPSENHLTALLQKIGFDGSQHLVVYDDEGGGWAGRFIWTLDYINHTNYSYLNGGLHAWLGAKLPIQSGQPITPQPSNFAIAQLNNSVRAQAQDILPNLKQDGFKIWDARSPAEYSGAQVFAQQGGHIPGAINLEWTQLMDTSNHLRLLPLEDIQQRLNSLGLGKDQYIVTHCQSHHRSGLTYLVAKILGYHNIQAYDGSWSDWGNDLSLPVET